MIDPEQTPIILTYHSISDDNPPLSLPVSVFVEQMDWLGKNVRILPLAEIVEAIRNHQPLPRKAVVLTFDDGFQDFYLHAAAELRRRGFPAMVFLPTAFCGKTNAWSKHKSTTERPLLTWEQVRELSRQQIQFGSHSCSHPDMSKLGRADAEAEMTASKQEIEEHTHLAADFFCYPYGRWNKATRDLASRHFRGACSTGAGAVHADADPFVLPRIDAHYVRNPALFRIMFTRLFLTYVGTRRLIRRLRGQPEGHYQRRAGSFFEAGGKSSSTL